MYLPFRTRWAVFIALVASNLVGDLFAPLAFAEGSLLQIRMVPRDSSKHLAGPQEWKIFRASNQNDWNNMSERMDDLMSESIQERDDTTSDVDLVDEREVEMVESTTMPAFNLDLSGEKMNQFPNFQMESGNDSGEIFLSGNETDRYGWTDLGWTDVALVTLFCSIIAGTVAGNMLVIAAVVTTRRLRTVTNCFVMSLAVADWLVGMFVMPPKVFLYLVDNEWRFGRIFCELWISLDILLCTASILSLCAISIDRYLAITRPLAYSRRRRSKRLALSMISCVWIAAVVITSPPIFGWYEENRNTENKCEYNENTGYVVYSALGSFFLPLLVMLYVYARIACVITRRQRSIQKLHTRGDRKSQYCGSDAEEPLHQRDREDEGGREGIGGEQSHKTASRLSSSKMLEDGDVGEAENQEITPQLVSSGRAGTQRLCEKPPSSQPRSGSQESTSFLGRFRLSSCTEANNDEYGSGKSNKKHGEHLLRRDKFGDSSPDSPTTADAAVALSLPDPATLASGNGTENSSSSVTDPDSTCGCSHSIGISQMPASQHQQQRPCGCSNIQNHRHHNHHYVSRLKTGSRLCHHSIATASPQKNIHRAHQTSGSSSGGFGEDRELHLGQDGNCRSLDQSPRVWTVEATSLPAGGRKGKESKANKANCRSCSYEHEAADSTNAGDKAAGPMESIMMMECSPAGNPASLMSAASASGNTTSNISPSPHDKRSPFSNRIQSRNYQPHHVTQNSHHRVIQSNPLESNPGHTSVGGIQRARSMKFVSHILSSGDQNHNGGTATRDFSSGRIASFKRETKTAQTLAAVVGGFIICWLPFFVAYVMGPFTPSSDTIPTALMDALIWLGWSNSAINPFIYAFYSADFRSAFWRLTLHKCEALLRNRNQARSSPRRYEDPPPQHRVSA